MLSQTGGILTDLHDNPKMKRLCSEIVAFLSAAARVGHVFIVTAGKGVRIQIENWIKLKISEEEN